MKKFYFVGIFVVVVAFGLGAALQAAGAAQYATTPRAKKALQAKPFTMTYFGPWNEEVAKKHVPTVTFERTGAGLKVTVRVDNHPMDPQKPHWIEWIRLEDADGRKLGEKRFKATDPGPATAVFELPAVPGKVKALERCNIHGTWLNEAAVELK